MREKEYKKDKTIKKCIKLYFNIISQEQGNNNPLEEQPKKRNQPKYKILDYIMLKII